MRILMVWSENLNKPGSGRTHFVHLARGFAAEGHWVRIVAPGYPPRTEEPLGVPVSYVPTFRRSMAAFLLFHVLVAWAMPYFILRYRVQVVYTRALFHSFLMYLLCCLMGRAYVAEIDSIVDQELAMRGRPGTARLIRLFDRWNLRWASLFVCVTEGLKLELIRRGAAPDRVAVVHNGAAVELFTPGDRVEARRALNLPADAAIFGFVGTLAAWQGLDLLVEAASRLDQTERTWRVVIVGSGELRDRLVALIAERNLEDRFLLRSAVAHEQAALYLQACDAAVIPIHDGRKLRYGLSPLKFWEAMSVGLPVLVPDAGGLGPVLDELQWPGQFAAGDARSLAHLMRVTIQELDSLRERRHGVHDRIVRDHSWSAVARRTVEAVARRCPRLRKEPLS